MFMGFLPLSLSSSPDSLGDRLEIAGKSLIEVPNHSYKT
jgi:hypothetical protein